MAGSCYCELHIVWQGTHDWTWSAMSLFMVGCYMLVQTLSSILVMPGWPLWSVYKHFDLNNAGVKKLTFHAMQKCSMARSSLICQKSLRITCRLLQCSGQPLTIFWMRILSVFSAWVAFWIFALHASSTGVDGDIKAFRFVLLWADSAKCISYWFLDTGGICNDKIVWLKF